MADNIIRTEDLFSLGQESESQNSTLIEGENIIKTEDLFSLGKTTDPASENTDSGSESGSSVLLDRIEAGDFGEEPVEEKVAPSKFDNFFTEINPTAVDNTAARIVDTSKLDIGRETVDNFMSDESFEDLHKQYTGVKFNKIGLGNGTVTVKLPGQKSPRPFEVPSDDEGLGRLKFEIADYIENKKVNFVPSKENDEIDRIWAEHSKKWDAEDLMSDELQTLLGSDYVVETSGTLGNEFTVTKDKGDGASINIMVGGADRYGNNQSSDVLKRFLTQGQERYEDTPEYKKDKKEITAIANNAYLNNPAKLNEIFERNSITNFSEIATPKNKEALVQHILSDQNALGGMFSTARTNFDNLTNVEIDEILTSVVDSHVGVEWDAIAGKDANKERKELDKKGYTDIEVEDMYYKRHSANFSVLESGIKDKLIEIDRGMHLPGQLEAKNAELNSLIERYRKQGGANYDVLMDMSTGKLAPSVSDQKNENIINLNEQVQESMANYEGLTRGELKIEFLKTSAALQEFEDKTKNLTRTDKAQYHGMKFTKYTPGLFGQYQSDKFDVLLQQKADLLSKMEALKRTYLLNERIETVDKSDLAGLVQQAGRSFVHSVGDNPNTAIINNGVTEAQTVAAIKDLYDDLDIPLSAAARKHSKTNTFDMVAEGVGGLPRVVVEFGGYGKVLNGVKYITGLNKWIQGLNKVRYKQGSQIISEANVAKKANKWAGIEGKDINLSTIGSYITTTRGKNAIEILKPTLINQAKAKAVAAVSEGLIFTAVEKDIEGMPKGIAFNLAGGIIPPAIKSKLVGLNTLYKVGASGIRMAGGNKAGEAFNALLKDVSGHQEWQTFLKENYDDPDALMGSVITDLVLGGALVGMHLNKMDFQSYKKVKESIGTFDTKRRGFTEVDAEGNRNVIESKRKEFDKWNDLYHAAQKRTWELEGLEDYSNPLLAPALAVKEAKGVEADVKKMGYDGLDVVWKTEGETGRKGGAILNKNTNKWEIQLDPNNLTPGLVGHELGHPLFHIKMMDKPTKAATIKKLLDITKDIEYQGKKLYDLLETVGIKSLDNMDLAKVQESELFSYISEALRNGGKFKNMDNSNWYKLQQWIKGESPNKSKQTAIRTKNDIINWFGEYHKNIGEGGSNLAHYDKLADIVAKYKPYGKAAETTAPGDIFGKPLTSTKDIKIPLNDFNEIYGKDAGLSSKVIDSEGRTIIPVPTKEEDNTFNDELQKIYSRPRDPRDVKKLDKLRDFTPKRENYKTQEEFEKAEQTIAKEILTLEAGKNVYEIINLYDPKNTSAGAARIYGEVAKYESGLRGKGWSVIEDAVVKDFLTGDRGIKGLTAEYNRQVQRGDIDPATFPLGKFIGGKFSVRFLESVNKFKKEAYEKSTSEETTRELVASKDPLMEALETEDMSIAAQIKRKKLLEEKGLTEETAETYVAEQNLITLSKELGLKENIVEKAQATIPELKQNMSPQRAGESSKDYNKRIVSHKNSIDQYRKSIEKDIVVDFFNVSEATYNKMSVVGKEGQALKTAMAWQIKGTENKPGDLQAVKKVVEANPATILTAISKGAQNKLDPIDFTDVAPDAIRGKSAGVPKVLLKNELLFTPTSKRQQTAAGLQPFMQSEAFIKYQKTKDATYKADFEQKFVESLKTPQDYKAVMQEVGKNVYLQSVRSALPKESILARHLEAGKNEGLNSELFDQIIKDKPNANEGDIYKLLFSPKYNKFNTQDKIKFFDDITMKFAESRGKSEVELIKESRDKPTVEMEAIQTKSHNEMIENLSKDFGKKGELFDQIKKEGLDDYTKNPIEKTRSDIFEAALANQYPIGAESIIIKNASNGKNKNWNFKTKQYELISYEKGKDKTIKNWFNHNLGGQKFTGNGKKITDTEIIEIDGKEVEVEIYDFFRVSKTVNTGDFKTKMANEMVAAANRGASLREMVEINHKLGREMVAGKNGDFNAVLKANQMKRQFHLDAIKNVVENHADYGLTRQEAIQAAVRHVRRHTNITDSSIKGTATITAGSMEIGIPVGKQIASKTHLGTMYHAEHQMQLQNHTYTFFDSLGRNWNSKTSKFNNKRYNEEMEILSELFEQSTTVKQDQLIYDSPLFGGNTTYLKSFAGKKLGEVSSILNILYQPGVAGSMVDYKSKTPKTIAESIIDNYNQKQLDILLKESSKIGEPNALHYELNSRNKNRTAVEKNNLKIARKGGIPISKNAKPSEVLASMKIGDKAFELGRKKSKKSRGMTTADFDDTMRVKGNEFVIAKGPQGRKIKLSSEEFPIKGPQLVKEGYTFDFSDFINVKGGMEGPFFSKFKERLEKFGPENMFILTARPAESATAIHEWLKTKDIKIPLKNITGLANSTGEAKAMWMLQKFSEGYNDMFFIDDALPNVKAVKKVLDQLDIKSDVQQALASKNLGEDINNMMEHSLDIGAKKVFSKAEAKVRGKDIKRRRVFMRDSAADLELLIEPLYGKGKEGIKNKKWFKEEFVMPFERGIRDYNTARQSAKNDYMNLRKQNKDVVKEISKPVEGTAFTNDMAMRVYLWNKAGYKIPDLAKTTEAKLVQHIASNPKLQAYAENFARITKQEKGLKEPGENWWGETMAGEVTNLNRGVSRKQYLQEWIERKNEIFTEENLNKMESKLGTEWRENVTDMFDRMETGRTRSLKMDRGSTAMMNYLNGGIGTIMNFNTRSAVLQTISTTNFLNMRENNPIAAARAMGNVKQFAKDFKYIMNSDMLKQRRDGLAMNVTEAEIASAAASSKNPVQSIISKVLKAGYLPTKMADSFAISFGGATFYRNRVKMYEKQGMKTKEAESQAFLDFQVIAERTQQSSRADLLSKQQTSLIGRFILPFANTPMQMNRAGMKDILDISKGRYKNSAEVAEKVGRISYYMGAQVAIFAGLQSALFAMLLNDDDVSDEKVANTKSMMLNTTADSMLRGFGVQGAVMSATKNALQEYFKQSAKPGFTADYSEVAEDLLNISPPIGSKFGMLDRAGDRKKWAKIRKNDEFKFELGNPSLEASLMTVQAVTNAPVYSPYQNLFNMKHALSDQYETWQRVLMGAGWTPYSVGVETEDKKKKKKKSKKKKSKTFKVLR